MRINQFAAICMLVWCTQASGAGSETSATAAAVTSPTLLSATVQLPEANRKFSARIAELVHKHGLDAKTPADKNPDNVEAWGSVCVVDLRNPAKPRVGGWEQENFVYPASSYKMYVLGELIRQVCAGDRSLDDATTVAENNWRPDSALQPNQVVALGEVLRLMCAYSDNTAANVAIDVADRRRVTSLLHALGCKGSDVTRKFLPRTREDAEFTSAPSTVSSALHFARFLYAVERGAIGGGRGRGLIKGYLAMNEQNDTRIRAGVPASATVFSKTGEWNTFTTEAAMVEDGDTRYIVVIMTVMPIKTAAAKMAALAHDVHQMLKREPRKGKPANANGRN